MTVELVTGYSGTAHVSSSEDGARQAGTVGTGMYVLETVDDPIAATLENAQTVTVGPGDLMINGRHVQLTGSTTYSVPVGVQGQQTSNILAVRYSVDDSGVEKAEPVTLTGSPAPSDPPDPTLYEGSILDGDSPIDMPLYRVVTTGIETAEPVALFETVPPIDKVRDEIPKELDDLEGVLPLSKGGTGLTASPSMLVNLASTAADSVLKSSPRPGVTGTLPIARGGTGATSAANALKNFGLTATASELNNLDGVFETLWSGTWTSGTITVPKIGNYRLIACAVESSLEEYGLAFIDPTKNHFIMFSNSYTGTSGTSSAVWITRSGTKLTIEGGVVGMVNADNSCTTSTYVGIYRIVGIL